MDLHAAGIPRSFTRLTGNPDLSYRNVLGAVYVQDDIRIRKNLTLSPGIRYELQTHLDDYNNFAPRFGVNWAPFKSGKTTIRASAGIFYDWFSASTYEQTLRIDGFRQRELNVLDPSFPNPGPEGVISATNQYLMTDDLQMVRSRRLSAGLQHTLTPRIRFGFTYSNTHFRDLMRGENLNIPVDGVRPDPRFSNVIEIEGDAESKLHMLSSNFSISFMTPSPAAQQARFDWRRGSVNLNHNLGYQKNNSDGAFATPFSGSPAGEWGSANNDIRHRFNVGINSQALKNFNLFINGNINSAPPYTHQDRHRRQRRPDFQRPSSGSRAQHGTRLSADQCRRQRVVYDPLREAQGAGAAGNLGDRRSRRYRLGEYGSRRRAGALPDIVQYRSAEPRQSRQPCRLQRHDDLTLLPSVDRRRPAEEDRPGHRILILTPLSVSDRRSGRSLFDPARRAIAAPGSHRLLRDAPPCHWCDGRRRA